MKILFGGGDHGRARRYKSRAALGILTTLILLGHVSGQYRLPYIDAIEDLLYDTRVRLTAPRGIDDRIVIVAIDEASLERHGHWPFTRDKFAQLMYNLWDYGAAVVAFDVLFAERDESADIDMLRALAAGKGDRNFRQRLDELEPLIDRDALFAEAIAAGPTVLGFYFETAPEVAFQIGQLPYEAFELHESMMESTYLPRAEGYTAPLPVLMDAAWSAGFISNPLIDVDGVVRRAPLLHEYNLKVYESLSLATAATYLNDITLPVFVDTSAWMGDYPPLEGLELAETPIPIDPQGAVLVPYRGPAGSFPYVSIGDVISGTVEHPSMLEGRVAIIGGTAPGMRDLRTTPFGSVYPGVEIHANLIAGIIDGNFRWEPAYTAAAELLTVIAFGVLTALLLPALSPLMSTLITGAIMMGAVMVNFYIWEAKLHVLPLAMTLLTLLLVYAVNMLFGYLFETRARSHMDSLFGQYVPPDLVKAMSRDPQHYSLASERRELSVLFTDIRGFTTISERMDPDELSELMDDYLTPMTQIVHETQGTIDKYIGDAVMAFWGAPAHLPNHAAMAVRAGLCMLDALDELNVEFREKGWPEVSIGVGVNTGIMSVGNMGSRFRRAYTVLGDAVNLGSRLEGLTKAYGVSMLVSENTAQAADGYVYREIDRVRVRGKAEPVTIYEPLGLRDAIAEQQVDRSRAFHRLLIDYRGQSWDTAEEALLALLQDEPDCVLYKLYLERIGYFRTSPPEPGWDGVFTHESK